jgi:hypothetical protein
MSGAPRTLVGRVVGRSGKDWIEICVTGDPQPTDSVARRVRILLTPTTRIVWTGHPPVRAIARSGDMVHATGRMSGAEQTFEATSLSITYVR